MIAMLMMPLRLLRLGLALILLLITSCIQGKGQTTAVQHDREFAPKVISEPQMTLPDSLLPVKQRVKILVRVEIDSCGTPLHAYLIASTDKRYDATAVDLALKYRFAPRSDTSASWSRHVLIPFSFESKLPRK